MKIPLRFGEKANLTMCIIYIYVYIHTRAREQRVYMYICIFIYIFIYIKNDRPLFYLSVPSFFFFCYKQISSSYYKREENGISLPVHERNSSAPSNRLNKVNTDVCLKKNSIVPLDRLRNGGETLRCVATVSYNFS